MDIEEDSGPMVINCTFSGDEGDKGRALDLMGSPFRGTFRTARMVGDLLLEWMHEDGYSLGDESGRMNPRIG